MAQFNNKRNIKYINQNVFSVYFSFSIDRSINFYSTGLFLISYKRTSYSIFFYEDLIAFIAKANYSKRDMITKMSFLRFNSELISMDPS